MALDRTRGREEGNLEPGAGSPLGSAGSWETRCQVSGSGLHVAVVGAGGKGVVCLTTVVRLHSL